MASQALCGSVVCFGFLFGSLLRSAFPNKGTWSSYKKRLARRILPKDSGYEYRGKKKKKKAGNKPHRHWEGCQSESLPVLCTYICILDIDEFHRRLGALEIFFPCSFVPR